MNWIRGIDAALASLQNLEQEQAYVEVRSIYGTMLGGNGTFSDFYIQRENFEEQNRANQNLDEVRDSLWQLFESEDTNH